MLGLDEHVAELGGGGLAITLVVALLLGLRHATDPDHLTAVCTLAAGDGPRGARSGGLLGLFWGAGHAVTLLAFGLPVLVFGAHLPEWLLEAAEIAVGVLIAGLALRLLVRWRRGTLHVHPHRHGDVVHAHPHVHEHDHPHAHAHGEPEHAHPHAERLGRSPLSAFGVGLVHGVGGSGGASIVIAAGAGAGAAAGVALVVLAVGTAVAMAVVSAAFAHAVTAPQRVASLERLAPVYGIAGLAFGAWYLVAAVAA